MFRGLEETIARRAIARWFQTLQTIQRLLAADAYFFFAAFFADFFAAGFFAAFLAVFFAAFLAGFLAAAFTVPVFLDAAFMSCSCWLVVALGTAVTPGENVRRLRAALSTRTRGAVLRSMLGLFESGRGNRADVKYLRVDGGGRSRGLEAASHVVALVFDHTHA